MENYLINQQEEKNIDKGIKRGISTVLALTIIIVLALIAAGGVLFYQYFLIPREGTFKSLNLIKENEIAGWKTYRNEKYGFEIKYPDSIKIEEGGCGPIFSSAICPNDNKDEVINFHYFKVEIFTSNTTKEPAWSPVFALPLKEFAQKLWSYNKEFKNSQGVGDFAETSIGGQKAYTFSLSYAIDFPWQGILLSKKINLLFFSKSDIYNGVITFEDENSEIVNQILSTFKFIDQTADWETYNETDIGFSFKYPKTWLIKDDLTSNTCCLDIFNFDPLKKEGPPIVTKGEIKIEIATYTKLASLTLINFASSKTCFGDIKAMSVEDVNIAGINGIKSNFEDNSYCSGSNTYYLPRSSTDGVSITVFNHPETKEVFKETINQLLSTFKFIK